MSATSSIAPAAFRASAIVRLVSAHFTRWVLPVRYGRLTGSRAHKMARSPWEEIVAGVLAGLFLPAAPATPAKRPFWKSVEFYSAVAAIGSLVAALAALWSIWEASDIASRDQLGQAMQLYLTTYLQEQGRLGADAFGEIQKYNHLKPEEKAAIQIVDGLLVSVVDAMYLAHDTRVDTWKKYIQTIRATRQWLPPRDLCDASGNESRNQSGAKSGPKLT